MTLSTNKTLNLALAALVAVILLSIVYILLVSSSSAHHQQSLLNAQQSRFAKTANVDPILKYLPYGTLDYTINPSFVNSGGKRVVELGVSIYLTGADYNQSHQAIADTVAQKEQSAMSYIRSKGFDPAEYKIQYVVPYY